MLLIIASAIRIVPEYARMVIFRLGRFVRAVGPGLVFLLPFIDRGVIVDLRGKTETINSDVATRDHTGLNIQLRLNYRIVSPEKSLLDAADLPSSIRQATRNRLKSIVGNLTYGDIIHDRARIEIDLKSSMDEPLKIWGCEIISLEILEFQRA